MRSGSRRPTRWGRVLVGLLLVAAATFIAAYWLPLFRAHDALTQEHRRALDKSQELERSLAAAKQELATATARREALEAEQKQREATQSSAGAEVETLKVALGTKLEKLAKKTLAGVGVQGESLVIGLADTALLAPKKLEVSAQGKQLLCDVAKSIGSRSLLVVAVDVNEKPQPPLAQKYPTAWALRAARAASVAETLETKCGMKGTRLRAAGLGAPTLGSPALSGIKLPPAHFELTISPERPPG